MNMVDAVLVICGDGNFMHQAKQIVKDNSLSAKVIFTGWLDPDTLREFTKNAHAGVNILEKEGLNHQYSLSNRFFDYIQAAVPQVCVDYRAYSELNNEYHCALMVNDTQPLTIAEGINRLLNDDRLYESLKNNCMKAREVLNWGHEEKKLIDFYQNIFRADG